MTPPSLTTALANATERDLAIECAKSVADLIREMSAADIRLTVKTGMALIRARDAGRALWAALEGGA